MDGGQHAAWHSRLSIVEAVLSTISQLSYSDIRGDRLGKTCAKNMSTKEENVLICSASLP